MLTIETLPPDELAIFLMRYRRGETLERFEPRLDFFLREILAKANEFVPSESGAILLDDPRAKVFGRPCNQLTFIAAFGAQADRLIGEKLVCDRGVAGRVYSTGRSTRCTVDEEDTEFYAGEDQRTGLRTRSVIGVPVILGNSVCGVLQLINCLGRERYSEEERTLMEIFAGYISSSIQNVLDGIRAKELARRDDLTGLFNDRYFHYRLREEIRRAETGDQELSLLFLDLDRFKEVNDRFGHLEGSRTLHEVGILLDNEVPPGAIAARYGGDEFVIILPQTDLLQAAEIAHRLQQTINATHFLTDVERGSDEARVPITASMGVASLREHIPPAENSVQRANALIRIADSAMYRAKAEGRNRVIVAQSKTKEYPIAALLRRDPPDSPDRGPAQPGGGADSGVADDLSRAPDPLRDRPGYGRSG
jgi:diguanylate cyclase (GGDEF)-like protein